MAAKNPYPHQDAYLAFQELTQLFDEVVLKGKKTPYTSLNGYMTCFLTKEGGMAMRMGEQDILKFLETFNTKQTMQHGKVMKAFVDVPKDLQFDIKKLSTYFRSSLDHAKSLKPK